MPGRANNVIRYAIYTRQSVEKIDDLGSCEVQFITCHDHAQATGEPNLHWTGQRFDDDGYSGATLDRPAMRRLRRVIDLGGIDRLYAVALDRLIRSQDNSSPTRRKPAACAPSSSKRPPADCQSRSPSSATSRAGRQRCVSPKGRARLSAATDGPLAESSPS